MTIQLNPQLLEAALRVIRDCPVESLPRMQGTLAELQGEITKRLHAATPPAPAAAPDEYLSVGDAARLLNCSKDTLYKKSFPFVRRLGRKRLFSRKGIEEYLDNPRS
jgi:excisionase family DNA binding protein